LDAASAPRRASLPDELCTRLEAQLELLCGSPPAAKLSLALATKAEAAGAAPAWALRHLPRPGEEALGVSPHEVSGR
jgi:hypothetical protein